MNWWQRLVRTKRVERELDSELRFHFEQQVADKVRTGMTPAEAYRSARLEFGGFDQVKEDCRESRGTMWVTSVLQDLRFALRTLRRAPAFTYVAVVILGLGIGMNVAVFSIVDTLLLRPLPFPNSQRLAWLAGFKGVGGLSFVTYSVGIFEEFQRHNRSFEAVTSYNPFLGNSEYKLLERGEAPPVTGVMVAENFFQTLGIRPELGRLFWHQECQKGGQPAVILSHFYWQRQFAADPGIVGQAITLNHQHLMVIGVLPASFDFGSVFQPGVQMDVYVPAVMDNLRDWGNTLTIFGRLKPGVSVAQAQAEADVLFPQILAGHNDWWQGYSATISSLKAHVSGKLRRSLIVLWCAVGSILLIVCVNLSNLLLVRAASRSREFALRTALGAARGRIVRQLLIESLVLSTLGSALGVALAAMVLFYLARQNSVALPLLSSVRLDLSAIAWTMLLTIGVTVLFGLAPSLKISSRNLHGTLKDSGPQTSPGRKHEGLRNILVISEIALACVLLVSAGLLLRSFLRVLDVDLGFQPSHTAALRIDVDDGGNAGRRSAMEQEILQRVAAVPGIKAAGIADMLPLDRNRNWMFVPKGRVYARQEDSPAPFAYVVTPGYFATMGIEVLRGRDISWQDGPKSQRVVVINQSMAKNLWPGEDPIGKIAAVDGSESRVVGVVSDVRETTVEDGSGMEIYVSGTQNDPEGTELVVRSNLPPSAFAANVMQLLRSMNPGQPVSEFRPLQQIVDRAVSPRRFFVILVGVFATLGLVLAALGIYGVISYSVAQQAQEIGIRIALGATRSRIQLGVVGRTLRLALIGIGIGIAASYAAAVLVASLLYSTRATDPITFACMAVLLTLVALLAGYLPALRASRISPMITLRDN